MYLGFPVTDKAGARAGVSRSWYSRYVISGCVPASSVVFPEGVSGTRLALVYWLQPTAITIFTTEILFYFNTSWSFVKPWCDRCRKISSQLLGCSVAGDMSIVWTLSGEWCVVYARVIFDWMFVVFHHLNDLRDKSIPANQVVIRQPMCWPDQRHSD